MNHSPEDNDKSQELRSDINATRRRMDDTMDALGERLQPRHLVDEVLGFLRGETKDGDARLSQMREKITHSANAAMHSVVDAVKHNPMPALLIGAGVAWMIYESRRDKSPDSADGNYYGQDRDGDPVRYNPDTHYDRPLQYPSGYTENGHTGDGGSKLGALKDNVVEKASAATDQVRDKLAHVGEVAREKAGALRERAGELTTRVKEGTREVYTRNRERVVRTADQHPLEVGLVALAAGLIAGLAIPTPNAVNRRVGPTADRLRDRTREAGTEMLEKGKRIANATVSALKEEAQAQGVTPEFLREKAAAVGERAKETVEHEARQEGLMPEDKSPPAEKTPTATARQ